MKINRRNGAVNYGFVWLIAILLICIRKMLKCKSTIKKIRRVLKTSAFDSASSKTVMCQFLADSAERNLGNEFIRT